jgi:ADP-ribose pyrophosphatase YjhB (NUDIX family)
MQIKSTYKNKSGKTVDYTYYEDFDVNHDVGGKIMHGVHAYCFYGDKMVLVNHPKSGWTPPGGHIEIGEKYEDTLIREVKEETNMRVLKHELIGFIDLSEPDRVVRQTRSLCIVEPYGDFITDPDGEIAEIKLIDPADYKQYFDWGEIGERMMKRALELKNKFENSK